MEIRYQDLMQRLEALENEARQAKNAALFLCHGTSPIEGQGLPQIQSIREARKFGRETSRSFNENELSRARRHIDHRRSLKEALGVQFAAGPVWDMLLELYLAKLSCERVCIKILTLASDLPGTTALRWIKVMEEERLIVRQSDPNDARRVFVELTPEAARKISSLV